MKTITEIIKELALNPLVLENQENYRNVCKVSGYLIRQPKFIKNDKTGVESCSFILYQINNEKGSVTTDSFGCMTYIKEIVEKLKTINTVAFIEVMGNYRYQRKLKTHYTQATTMKIVFELDTELTEQWEAKK